MQCYWYPDIASWNAFPGKRHSLFHLIVLFGILLSGIMHVIRHTNHKKNQKKVVSLSASHWKSNYCISLNIKSEQGLVSIFKSLYRHFYVKSSSYHDFTNIRKPEGKWRRGDGFEQYSGWQPYSIINDQYIWIHKHLMLIFSRPKTRHSLVLVF